jgi:2Fe-2S ferredoxin
MVKIIYIEASGNEHVVDVPVGRSVMQGAKFNDVPGIDADCGGGCACATCHVYIDPAWQARVGGRTSMEDATIQAAEDVEPNSRLSCQIEVAEDLDGLIVRMPPSQH